MYNLSFDYGIDHLPAFGNFGILHTLVMARALIALRGHTSDNFVWLTLCKIDTFMALLTALFFAGFATEAFRRFGIAVR